jgi:membrane-associated protein
MELWHFVTKFVLHLDTSLFELVQDYGTWTYLILFAIIFCETGLVFTPFLPGDSLLFAAGALAGAGYLNQGLLFGLLWAAAVIGDNSNYAVGKFLGSRILGAKKARLIKRQHVERTHAFFERYGTKTIILARFVPIVRTFTPFVAGLGRMTYRRFLPFDVVGGGLWVGACTFAGYFFGAHPFVKKHFSLVVLAIIFISILPGIIAFVRSRFDARTATGEGAATPLPLREGAAGGSGPGIARVSNSPSTDDRR